MDGNGRVRDQISQGCVGLGYSRQLKVTRVGLGFSGQWATESDPPLNAMSRAAPPQPHLSSDAVSRHRSGPIGLARGSSSIDCFRPPRLATDRRRRRHLLLCFALPACRVAGSPQGGQGDCGGYQRRRESDPEGKTGGSWHRWPGAAWRFTSPAALPRGLAGLGRLIFGVQY